MSCQKTLHKPRFRNAAQPRVQVTRVFSSSFSTAQLAPWSKLKLSDSKWSSIANLSLLSRLFGILVGMRYYIAAD
ncbi:uncharacterized protein BDR25DRAFT_299659 [Lindgomyces ingoldianus]|uniref:Uncharacterized protein n=1 Tax=Lindgomyces ingoldianus TaxID=673940 RepID=A0ACB6RGQ1_9PLEO|nr:uncharacterized protein BDR25DRAFT_299659 [Lindgomyces ingoldianus]KAF2477910.1 hypothetical protein BDR25DRAFT_299659 [Lindgomyces ingoldianus]